MNEYRLFYVNANGSERFQVVTNSTSRVSAIELSLFGSRVSAICEQMGAVLQRSAVSPNIRDRLDYSCALFDAEGGLVAQATHIPVHLGSMAYAMTELAGSRDWQPGDVLILNDPFAGGTHLPDVTVIAALFIDQRLCGFAASRAHYADIGSAAPGSMPISNDLQQEGVLIRPAWLIRDGEFQLAVLAPLLQQVADQQRVEADLHAQLSACRKGAAQLAALIGELGAAGFQQRLAALNDYGERLAQGMLQRLAGEQTEIDFDSVSDCMDDDGFAQQDIAIQLRLRWQREQQQLRLLFDFTGTADQVPGNINCPLSVTAAAVYYVVRSLLPDYTPNCAGVLRNLRIDAPPGCLLNATGPAAVAAGNVETSMRIVDVICKALHQRLPTRIPAASQGSMNNLAMGGGMIDHSATQAVPAGHWSYYETLAGGCGAAQGKAGASALHSHMTNTLNTPVEVLESEYPLRLRCYQLRRGSGGAGHWPGGDGIVREYEFLQPATVSVISERRRHAPWGLAGGGDAQPGENLLNGKSLPAKCELQLQPGDRLSIATPGGGGYGAA
ncbi:MAG: hydantoinase B/oxoprolinase family protein [Gammaproteobacteria bacterium]|nr:hydantoinase B/oxoprolinase family protein [Gammaproteobacteria bacterium]